MKKKIFKKELIKAEKEIERTLSLFVTENPYLKKRFVEAVLRQMQLTGVCFMDFLDYETKQIDQDFSNIKKILPKKAKRKSKK